MKQVKKAKVKDCPTCLASGKNPKFYLPKKHYGNIEQVSEPGQETNIDLTGKLHNKYSNCETQLLIAVDRFSKRSNAKVCKTSATKEVITVLSSNFIL